MVSSCLFVFPAEIGKVIAPILFPPWWIPKPPVNKPYPYAFWIIYSFSAPAILRPRAIHSPQISKSYCVYAVTVGLPVVPDDAWTSTISSRGTASNPKGYASLKSLFVVNGIFSISFKVFMSSGFNPISSNLFL